MAEGAKRRTEGFKGAVGIDEVLLVTEDEDVTYRPLGGREFVDYLTQVMTAVDVHGAEQTGFTPGDDTRCRDGNAAGSPAALLREEMRCGEAT